MIAVKAQFKKSDKTGGGRISESALGELIRKLCGPAITNEVIQSLLQSFDGGVGPRGSIPYDAFIEWLFESLKNSGGGATAPAQGLADSGYQAEKAPGGQSEQIVPSRINDKFNGIVRLFCSHQQTEEALRVRGLWLEGLQIESVKSSIPPFNVRLNIAWPPDWKPVDYNVATFGVKLPRVIMDFFETEEMQRISKVERSQIPIPPYALDSFVQKKMVKVLELVAECRKPEAGMDAESLKSATKLENFAKGFTGIDAKKISGPKEFEDFVHKHVAPGWEDQLHFDHVLAMFGFTKAASDKIRGMTIKVQEKDQEIDVTLEHHALRWLTKAFRGYGPVGCLTDMVNLVYAVLKMEQPKEASEEAVMDAVNRLQDKMKRNDLTDLWIPTHLVHDAETDDALTWLLLQRLHELQKTRLEVLIQMPPEEAQDELAQWLKNHGTKIQVFRDKDSSNGKAVSNTWSRYMEKKA